MKYQNEKYCSDCGSLISIRAEICPKCGVRQFPQPVSSNAGTADAGNRWIICLLLCWFLGVFGGHRFYSGHTVIGVIQLLTLGGCGIWAFIDFIIILSGNYKDAEGNPIKYS